MSRSYTNVTIPRVFDDLERTIDENEGLKFKLKQMEQKRNWLISELENIPMAVEEWGYVDISFGNKKIKLVKAPEEPKP